uniref:Uncharacterized protein n=1 Tax=Amphimedon queenslandica TaxID=400682 RepID=A0A1X7SET1_AMPQE
QIAWEHLWIIISDF